MQQDWFADVLEFHVAMDAYIGTKPCEPDGEVRALRTSLDTEEWNELRSAVLASDLPLVADSIVDLIYVLIGRAISYGIDLRPLWDAVHKAKLASLKPEGWQPPDIIGLLHKQVPLK